jgi:hypothetical protein
VTIGLCKLLVAIRRGASTINNPLLITLLGKKTQRCGGRPKLTNVDYDRSRGSRIQIGLDANAESTVKAVGLLIVELIDTCLGRRQSVCVN